MRSTSRLSKSATPCPQETKALTVNSRKTAWLGLDPGNTAGVAVILPDGEFRICQQVPYLEAEEDGNDKPPLKRKKKKKKKPMKKRPDLSRFKLIVSRAKTLADLAGCELRACVEDVGAMPTDARATAFTFGYAVGSLVGVLSAMEVPITKVRPAVWKKYFGLVKEQGMSSTAFKALSCGKLKELTGGVTMKADAAEAGLIAYYAFKIHE